MHGAAKLTWITEWLVAAAVAAGLLWLSILLVPQGPVLPTTHGERFALMAVDPLAFEGAFPQRVLWPLLAWLASFVGVGVLLFSQLCSGALLMVVCWFAHRRSGSFLDALLVTAAIAASGAVLVYQPMVCLSDSLTLLLFVLLLHFAERPRVFWPMVLLSALSHEMVFFFWPWLLYLRCQNGGRVSREAVLLVLVFAIYMAFRAPLGGSYGVQYYIDNSFWVPWGLPALWALWAFVIVVEFGPMLVVGVWAVRTGELSRPSTLGGRWGTLLYFAGVLPLMILAYDVMRFATFAFLPLLLGSLAFLRVRHGRLIFTGLLLATWASYWWLHPNPSQQGGAHFTVIAAHVKDLLGLLVTRTAGDAASFTWELLLRTWPIAVAGIVGAAVIVATGWWMAARLTQESPTAKA